MTDIQAKLITRNTMVPKLKADDPAGALKAGVDDAIRVLGGDKDVAQKAPPNEIVLDAGTLIGIAIVVIILMFILQASLRRRRRGRNATPWIVGGALGGADSFSDSGSSGSDSGSFSGGGGGDSGGGGASDSY